MLSLAEENAELRAKLTNIMHLLNDDMRRFPDELHLTPSEKRMLVLLVKREWVPHDALRAVAGRGYADNIPCDYGVERVHIHHLRRKLAAENAGIERVQGEGYRLDPAARQRFRKYV